MSDIIYTFTFDLSRELLVFSDLCKLVRCVSGWYNQNSARMKYRWELQWLKGPCDGRRGRGGAGRAGGLSLPPRLAAVVQVKV